MLAIVVGTRPEMTKMAPVLWELDRRKRQYLLIHTGQHYDYNLYKIFLDELNLHEPDAFLGVGSGTREEQIQKIELRCADCFIREKIRCVVVEGDTNSVLGAAKAAKQCGIFLAHVESGARSFDPSMPEEANRVETDRLSDVLFAPTANCLENLKNERLEKKAVLSGNTEVETLAFCLEKKKKPSFKVPPAFHLVTLHRQSNATPEKLKTLWNLLAALNAPAVFLVHPRTENVLKECGLWEKVPKNVQLEKPVGYFELIWLLEKSDAVLTDSGGLQVEAASLGKPLLILRNETEWVEVVAGKAGALVGLDAESASKAKKFLSTFSPRKDLFKSGASRVIVTELMNRCPAP